MTKMDWEGASRRDGVPRELATSRVQPTDWPARGQKQDPWEPIGPDLEVPTCPGVVRWANRSRRMVLHVEWIPPRGTPKRIAQDRAEYLLNDLGGRGVIYRPLGRSMVAEVIPRDDDRRLFGAPALMGGGPGVGANWEVTERDGLWWVRVARTSMPLDALIWRMAYR